MAYSNISALRAQIYTRRGFETGSSISLLQNGDTTTCSFGTTKARDQGFWRYGARIEVNVQYEGWFGRTFHETQHVIIQDSDSFTGLSWSD